MNQKISSWCDGKNDITYRHRLLCLHKQQIRNNHIGTNGKSHQPQNHWKHFGIKIPSQYGKTGMDKLNVQWTCPPVPGLKDTYRKLHNILHFPIRKTKGQKGNLRKRSMQNKTSENRDSYDKTHCRSKSYILSRDVSTPSSYLTKTKIHVYGSISEVKSRYMCMDVKYFYLNNQMNGSEYIMIQISMIPLEFMSKYNHNKKGNMDTSSKM